MVEAAPFISLVDGISLRRQCDPQGMACVFLEDDGRHHPVSNEQFYADMQRYARGFAAKGNRQGDIVLLALDHHYELVACFWGIICCGAIPSVLTYWHRGSDLDAYTGKVRRMAASFGARAVITLPELISPLVEVLAGTGCRVFTVQEIAIAAIEKAATLPELQSEQVALMQFTSGTTSQPKAIRFSHRQILGHIAASAEAYQITRDCVYVSWLPFYHDMGLIGHIRSLMHGGLLVSMSPQTWLRQPEIFLQAIHRYRGTMANMPNFGFEYCARRIRDEHLDGVDLSSWRVLSNGSEPVLLKSMQRFSERFARYGFRNEALTVGYGMAENVMGITVTPPGKPLKVDWISADGMQAQKRAIPVEADATGARAVVSCGYPYRGIDLAIVDDQWAKLAEREVGEITIRSNTLFTGYYLAPEANEGIFRDGWFRTGDVGYLADGQLFVCDRKKDLIIVGGRNIHPQSIENIAGKVFGAYAGRCVAFGLSDSHLGTEAPILIIEQRRQPEEDEIKKCIRRVRKQVSAELEIALAEVRVVPKSWVVKTTSGKIARAATKNKYINEGYDRQAKEIMVSPEASTKESMQLILTALFESVLGVSGIGPDDDFIKLGGDSLSALRLFLEIEQRFGREIPAAEFFQQSTVNRLVAILQQKMNGGEAIVVKQTPPVLAGVKQQLLRRAGHQPSAGWHGGFDGIKALLKQKVEALAYKAKVAFMIRFYGKKWTQRLFAREQICLIKQFYALLEKPLQSETEVIQSSMICADWRAIQKQLVNQVFTTAQDIGTCNWTWLLWNARIREGKASFWWAGTPDSMGLRENLH